MRKRWARRGGLGQVKEPYIELGENPASRSAIKLVSPGQVT